MANKIALGSPCSVCGQDSWWDNRQGRTNPKAPEYKCGTRDCKDPATGYPPGRWERDRAKWGTVETKAPAKTTPKEPQGGRITPDDTTPDERGERVFTYDALAFTYRTLFGSVVKTFKANEVPLDPASIQAAVATLLIQGKDQHIPLLHPRKVEKVAPKQVAKESYAEMPEGLDREDFDELPF